MTKKRFVEFYLSAMMKAATAGYVHRLGYSYYDVTHKEAVKVYREDGPVEIDVTGLDLVGIAGRVIDTARERERERELPGQVCIEGWPV